MKRLAAILAFGFVAFGAQAQTTRLAFIDPLSGGGASTGEVALNNFRYLVDDINAKGGVNGKKFEIIGFDNKTNPQESVVQARKAVDQGIRILVQGGGSSVAAALTDFVAKNNERNLGKEVMFLNYAAIDPVLTNEKCNYWHFRWDASSDIKLAALTTFMKSRQNIKKVYLINQDYSMGQSVRTEATRQLKEKRPDIQIVGDELHPFLKVTDFTPYVAKIKASGADSVITSNWGQDFGLLVKAAADASLPVDWYTFYGAGPGGPTGIKQTGVADRVFTVQEGFANIDHAASQKDEVAFRAKYNVGIWYPRAFNAMRMLAKAIDEAKSDDPKAIAAKLDGMKFEVFTGGEGWMRQGDHQFFQPMYIASFGPLNATEKFDEESTGWGWTNITRVEAADTVLPTTCKMNKPS
jgi:branched-chain amino acid transport system substrate-binding protein